MAKIAISLILHYSASSAILNLPIAIVAKVISTRKARGKGIAMKRLGRIVDPTSFFNIRGAQGLICQDFGARCLGHVEILGGSRANSHAVRSLYTDRAWHKPTK